MPGSSAPKYPDGCRGRLLRLVDKQSGDPSARITSFPRHEVTINMITCPGLWPEWAFVRGFNPSDVIVGSDFYQTFRNTLSSHFPETCREYTTFADEVFGDFVNVVLALSLVTSNDSFEDATLADENASLLIPRIEAATLRMLPLLAGESAKKYGINPAIGIRAATAQAVSANTLFGSTMGQAILRSRDPKDFIVADDTDNFDAAGAVPVPSGQTRRGKAAKRNKAKKN